MNEKKCSRMLSAATWVKPREESAGLKIRTLKLSGQRRINERMKKSEKTNVQYGLPLKETIGELLEFQKKKKSGSGRKLREVMPENFLNLERPLHLQVCEA